MSITEGDYVNRLREALGALRKVRSERDDLLREKNEPIAIVGMACRFPGGGVTPDAYWQSLVDGVDAVRKIVPERFPEHLLPEDKPGAKFAAFLDGLDQFDASFFGIAPREAEVLDPQQRLLLEVTWEALENAGVPQEQLGGSKTGIFVGITGLDYQRRVLNDAGRFDMYSATGNMLATSAGRIAFALGLQGPAVALDTACSSTLVAIHLACQSLRNGDSDMAIAGGVNAILAWEPMLMLANMQALSPDGRCKTFDSRANGYVRGEGCGLFVLKRLSDAQRDHDTILAQIRGSAVNQDGRSTGLTTPNVRAQETLLKQALANARLSPEEIDYIETHGTGTPLGDPIEFDALRRVFGKPRAHGRPCVLGAVKTNLGHLESAAGAASLMKVVLALRNESIPKNLHFRGLNPRISLNETPFLIPTDTTPWKGTNTSRIAGVSAFGLSGTNAHIIIEEAPPEPSRPAAKEPSAYILPLSAKSSEALEAMAKSHASSLSSNTTSLSDITYTAAMRRTHHEYRRAVVGKTRQDIIEALAAISRSDAANGLATDQVITEAPTLVFVFSGQGSQWANMGQALFDDEPQFREALLACDAALKPHTGFSVLDEIRAPEDRSRIGETIVAQPAIFALQVALFTLLKSWNISPAMVIGHSVGEIAAAHAADILELNEAARLVAVRSRVMQQATGRGKMATIGLSEVEVSKAIARFGDRLAIGAINEPTQVVISGDNAAVDEIVAQMSGQGVQCRPLRVNYAFHSAQMEPIRQQFAEELGSLTPKSGSIPMTSTVTGTDVRGSELDTAYWGSNIRNTVRFSNAVERVCEAGHRLFMEIGPHPVLSLNIEQILSSRSNGGKVIPTLRRQKEDRLQLLSAMAAAYALGVSPNWKALCGDAGRNVALPTYPWQRKRHWIAAAAHTSAIPGRLEQRKGRYSLSGTPVQLPGDTLFQALTINTKRQSYLSDHIVHGHEVVPGAFYLAVLLSIATDRLGATAVTLKDVVFIEALAIEGDTELYVSLRPRGAGEYEFTVSTPLSLPDANAAGFREHARGLLALEAQSRHDAAALGQRKETLDVEAFFQKLSTLRIDWGPRWRWIRDAYVTTNGRAVALAPVEGTNPIDAPLHPILIDNSFACAGWRTENQPPLNEDTTPHLPLALKELRWFGIPMATARAHFRPSVTASSETMRGDITIVSETGDIVCEIDDFALKRAPRHAFFRQSANELLFVPEFRPTNPSTTNASLLGGGRWLILCDSRARVADLGARLDAAGATWRAVPLADASRNAETPLAALHHASADGSLSGILCWWGTDADASPDHDTPSLAERNALMGLHLVQAVLQFARGRTHQQPLRWIWITEGAQPAENPSTLALEVSPLWGLGRAVQQEHPELGLKLVDVEAGASSSSGCIEHEMASTDDEPQVVWHGHRRLAARLVHAPMTEGNSLATRNLSHGTVLITGGLGALGLRIANWLWQEHRVGHLLLIGRRAPGGGASEEIARLEQQGAKITIARVDVTDLVAIREIVAIIPDDMPLRGVVHAAGVLDDGVLAEQSDARFSQVFAPKMRGAWNLHVATREMPLDFFVLFSSIASLFGSAGQSNYAAANAFLDALAYGRRAAGLPALSLNWGPWAEGGMATRLSEAMLARMHRKGILALEPNRALGALGMSLARPEPQIAIFAHDSSAAARTYGNQVPPMWRAIISTATTERKPSAAAAASNQWLEQLARLNVAGRKANVEAAICADVARVLGLSSPNEVQKDRPLQEQGLDSLMAVELRNAIAARIGKSLPATLVFDRPTVHALVDYLVGNISEPAKQPVANRPAAIPTTNQAIAIIGVGCRYPGGVRDLETFWHVLDQEIDTIRVVPRERWNVDDYYDARPGAAGKMNTREGGFLEGIEHFDPYFFGISPREATMMDPQQRLLLETTWEALEHAGIRASDVSGTDAGVFVGLMYHEYETLVGDSLELVDGHLGTGTAGSVASGRLSYVLGLSGPSMTVDTACSSSLVTVHLAVRSLRSGECSMALAGGVALMLTPTTHVAFNRMQTLSADGRCRPFDAAAGGIGWGEGCGMFVLKRLSDAVRDGDRILAVIRGTAVNQDGRSNGLLAPNGLAQEKLIRRALEDAGVAPADIDYVEAFGAGTTMGDVIEVQALGAVFGADRPPERPLLIGSAKSNFGHTQAAAGAAGLIKTALAMQHGKIPRSLHLTEPNPNIPWSDLHIAGAIRAIPWQEQGKPRLAGVSSFGLSGTNAHIILEEAPRTEDRTIADALGEYIIPLSAKKPEALRALADSYAQWLAKEPNVRMRDVAFTASVRRMHYDHRLAFFARTPEEFSELLASFVAGKAASRIVKGRAAPRSAHPIAFVFSDLDSETFGARKTLFAEEPSFRDKILEIDGFVRQSANLSILDEFKAVREPPHAQQPAAAELVMFAFQVALVELFGSWGIFPNSVIGYGAGEITAAHICGAMSLETALQLVIARGKLLQEVTGTGAMAWVASSVPETMHLIEGQESKLSIAAANAPQSVTLSGDSSALDSALAELGRRNVATRKLPMNYAAHHGPLMGSVARKLVAAIGRREAKSGALTMYSTLTGKRIDAAALVAEYWGLNMISMVNLAGAVDEALKDGCEIFIEIGSHPILAASLEQCAAERKMETRVLRTLDPDRTELLSKAEMLATLFVDGIDIDWKKLNADDGRVLSLPTYPWQRERFWIDRPRKAPQAVLPATEGEFGHAPVEMGELPEKPSVESPLSIQDPFADSFFEVVWQRKDFPQAPPSIEWKTGPWLVILDGDGFGAALADQLRARGSRVVEILDGESYKRLVGDGYRLDTTNPQHWEKLLAAAFGKLGCQGVIHCGALDATPWKETTNGTLAADVRRGPLCALRVTQAILKQDWRQTPKLHFITRGAQSIDVAADAPAVSQSTLWGFGRLIAMEHPNLGCVRIDLPATAMTEEVDLVLRELFGRDEEDQIAFRPDGRYVARLERGQWDSIGTASAQHLPAAMRPYVLEIDQPGILDGLALQPLDRRAPGAGEVEIEIEAAGLNFIDVLKAMGIYPGMDRKALRLGGECSGRIVAVGDGVTHLHVGQAVMASAASSFATHVTLRADFVVPKPPGLSFEQAATIPSVFMTIYWALHHVARLRRGERILIHSATGGTGLAAIQYARSVGAEVFATAGNDEKRAYLRSLGIEHVMDSRSLAFADEVLAKTQGRGVDVVLNSLTGDALVRSLEVLAPYGRFLEIGKKDIYGNSQLGLLPFRKALSYTAIDLVGMAADRPDQFAALLDEVARLFQDGTFQPLPLTVFAASEADAAFRLMAQARHIGKIAIRMPDPKATISITHSRQASIRADGTYLIAGGLGTLGLSLAKWMVQRGGRHIALVSRSLPNETARAVIRELENSGASVRTFQANIANRTELDSVVSQIDHGMPALRGVANAAAISADRTLSSMEEELFLKPLEPKLFGAWNLHAATRDRKLDFFITFSSATNLLGLPGRGSETVADAFADALCFARIADGLPAVTIHWGAIGDAHGATADGQTQRVTSCGSERFTPEERSAFFAKVLERPRPIVDVLRIEHENARAAFPQLVRSPFSRDILLESPPQRDEPAPQPPHTVRSSNTLLDTLQQALPEDRIVLLEEHLCTRIGQVLRMDPNRIDRTAPFSNLGMDSLMSLELRNRLESDFALKLPAALLFAYPTPAALAEQLVEQLPFAPPQPPPPSHAQHAVLAFTETSHADEGGDVEDDIEARLEAKLAMLGKYLD